MGPPGLLHPHRLRNLPTQHADGEHPLDNRARPLTSRLCYAAGLRPVLDPAPGSRGMAAAREGAAGVAGWVAGPGVACPKSRWPGCEPAARVSGWFPGLPARVLAC